jgi:type IVB pilus formation R64 PilN family outer membrane protein
MHRNIRFISSIIAMLVALSSCSSFERANQTTDRALAAGASGTPLPTPIVTSSDAPYLLGTPVQLAQVTPALLDVPYTFEHGRSQRLRQIAAEFSEDTGIAVDVSLISGGDADTSNSSSLTGSIGGLPPPPTALLAAVRGGNSGSHANDPVVSLWYHGTRKGFLDALAASAGVYWTFTDGRVKLFNEETKTFVIPALNRKTTVTSVIDASSGSSSGGDGIGGGLGGVSGSSSTSTGQSGNGGDTTVTTSSTTDVWKGIQATAKIVGGGAQVVADPQTGTLTVVGTPDQIQQVSDWVNTESHILTTTVAVTISIDAVQLSDEQNYGLDPTLAFTNQAKSFGINVTGASVPAVTGTATPFKFGASILSGEFNGTSGVAQALATLGTVTQIYSHTFTTLNGQAAPIQNGTNTSYIEESQLSTAANVGTTSAAIPGYVTSGFTGTVQPLVVGNKILLGVDFKVQNLLALLEQSTGQTSIQLPTTGQTVLDQSAALANGSTLMIAGYQEADTSITHNGVGSAYNPLFGGGGDASNKRYLVAIIVTAGTI